VSVRAFFACVLVHVCRRYVCVRVHVVAVVFILAV
jgi:hypothetical protein